MRAARHLVTSIAGLLLFCQGVALAVTPVSLCLSARATAAQLECTCSHDDGAACPMHHRGATSKSAADCSCRGAANPDLQAIIALLGPMAVLPGPLPATEPGIVSEHSFNPPPTWPDWSSVPDAPPPRA